MKPVRIKTWLLLVVMCVPVALCQATNSSEDEPVTDDYFNRVVDFATNTTGELPPGEEADNIRLQVFGANTRNWFQNILPNDEYIASCGGMSTSEKTIWQNSDYPLMENIPGFCTLNLLPPAGTCALRVHFEDLDLQPAEPDFEGCPPSNPFFKATTPDDLTAVYCQKLDGYEGILEISDTTEPTILLLQLDPSAEFQFKVSITAVNCNDIKTYESPSDCGIKNQDLKTMRAELFGDLASEQTQDPVVAEYAGHMPLAYRQRRRTYDKDSQSQDPKNKNNKKNKNSNNTNNKKTATTTTIKQIMHPVLEKFKEGIAAAEAAGTISKPNGNRVIGKQTTLANEWPWIVYIERDIIIGEFIFVVSCNGLLLDNSKVLTSRDCAMFIDQQPYGVADMAVRIGAHDLESTTEIKSKTVGVSKVTLPLKNEIYDPKDAFAILHLKEEVQLSENIRPICLPVSYNKFEDSGVVAGWDFVSGFPTNPLPNAVKVKVLDETTCNKAIENHYVRDEFANADVTCAADKFDIGVVCSSEQGSALTQRDRRGAYYVTGVAGSLQECFFEGVPTVFTKIDPDNQFLNIALA